jgi:hypothetical protein
MSNYYGEQSPEIDPTCSGGCCGRIDFDHVFCHTEDNPAESREFNDNDFYNLLMVQAKDSMYNLQAEGGASLYEQAYELAIEAEALGIEACFQILFCLHYFCFDDRALRMCTEITQIALQRKNTSLLRDIWKLLPELGFPGEEVNEAALILRDSLASMCPEVMNYQIDSGRF